MPIKGRIVRTKPETYSSVFSNCKNTLESSLNNRVLGIKSRSQTINDILQATITRSMGGKSRKISVRTNNKLEIKGIAAGYTNTSLLLSEAWKTAPKVLKRMTNDIEDRTRVVAWSSAAESPGAINAIM